LTTYSNWQLFLPNLSKNLRYSLGIYIDRLFVEIVGLTAEAQFSPHEARPTIIEKVIIKKDTLSFMFYTLLELKGINEEKFLRFSAEVEEIGRMLYGWKNQSLKEPPALKR